ncbi:MAG: nucleoside triphosphate pyrophosphohydrolase [Myxococcales bacterium]|nr:nucleoside triphosphate pyrophosphohydrolase [Myxococcales bacterium]MCB9669312.1 nucleoside triphosphate pyrophosphohydrolase [Alphaproteobacteria bacterium]MCB9690422.1 nucleoside triphosphate pyrophosphohydrolase [Alphaproteobacteria bacterium]
MDELLDVVRFLRSPDGCPWDRAQTPASMASFLIEEAYEVLGAVQSGDGPAVSEELGDLLFTATLLAVIREEAGHDGLDAVARRAATKMRDRHPRLFGHPEDTRTWQELKGPAKPGLGVKDGLPALLRAQRVGEAAAARGFDWKDARGPRAKVAEELAELDAAADGDQMEEELGDLLFSIVNLARHLGVDAEAALVRATSKFEGRFARVEDAVRDAGEDVSHLDAEALEATWQAVKEC